MNTATPHRTLVANRTAATPLLVEEVRCRRMVRPGSGLALALVAFALQPAPSFAGTAYPGGFEDNAGETNILAVGFDGTEYVITDTGAPLSVASGCRLESPGSTIARCPPVAGRLQIGLGYGDDQATVAAQAGTHPVVRGGFGADTITLLALGGVLTGDGGNDVLTGGPDRDRLSGGVGDDTILARSGGSDLLDCGPGADRVEADVFDWGGERLGLPSDDGNCEGVDLTRPVLEGLTGVYVKPGRRRIRIPVICSKRFCSGRVKFRSVTPLDGPAYVLRDARWARARFPGGGRRGSARVRLSARDHRALLKISGDASDATMLVELFDRAGHRHRSFGNFLM
jgi:hypothetical protein